MTPDLRIAAEAAEVLLRRQAGDGLASASWFSHQGRFLSSVKSETWMFGANRTGKSEAASGVGASYLRFGVTDPRPSYCGEGIVLYDRAVKVWAISLTSEMSRNVLQPKLFNNGMGLGERPPFIPESEIPQGGWNITNQTLRLKNGSICIFKSCEAGRDVFQGADVDLALFDEVPDEDVYREVTMRVGGGRRLLIRGAATILPPPGIPGGISWMFRAKVQPWLELGQTNEARNALSPTLDIITASIYDNPTILQEELRRMEAQYSPDSPEYRIRMRGELLPTIGGALVYPGFQRSYHVNQALAPTIDGRVTPQVNPYQPLVLAVDFNPENGVWLVGQRLDGKFRVVDEITLEHSDIASMTYEFRTRYPAHAAELWVYGDATGRRREAQTGESSFHLIAQYLTGYPVPIRFQLPECNPPVVDRVRSVQLHLRAPDGVRKIEMAPHCENLIADLEGSKWRPNGKVDKLHGRRSDAADCLGYWVVGAVPTGRFGQLPGGLKSIRSPR